jgi:hypothetical protein
MSWLWISPHMIAKDGKFEVHAVVKTGSKPKHWYPTATL